MKPYAVGLVVRIPVRTILDCHDFDVDGTLTGQIRRVGGQVQVEVYPGQNPLTEQYLWVKPRNLFIGEKVLNVDHYKWAEQLT